MRCIPPPPNLTGRGGASCSLKNTVIVKLGIVEIKDFSSKDVKRMTEGKGPNWKKIFVKHTSDKGLIFRIYRLLKT